MNPAHDRASLISSIGELRARNAQDRTDIQRLGRRLESILSHDPAPWTNASEVGGCTCDDLPSTMQMTFERQTSTTSCADFLDHHTYSLPFSQITGGDSLYATCIPIPGGCPSLQLGSVTTNLLAFRVAAKCRLFPDMTSRLSFEAAGQALLTCGVNDRYPILRYQTPANALFKTIDQCQPLLMTIPLQLQHVVNGNVVVENDAWTATLTE